MTDYDALRMSRSIGLTESGTNGKPNYRAVGDNGTSKGAYQWQKASWENHAQQVLGDKNAQMTPTNQDKVAYGMVKKWKDAGKQPFEIASMWNAGEGRPDAWKNHKGTTVINGKTISYDTPAYAKKVRKNYEDMGAIQPSQQTEQPAEKKDDRNIAQKVAGFFIDPLARVSHQAGQRIATSVASELDFVTGGAIGRKTKEGNLKDALERVRSTETTMPVTGTKIGASKDYTAGKAVGDIAQSALMLAPATGAVNLASKAGKLANLAKTTAYGASFGTAGALSAGKTKPVDVATSAIFGGVLGLATGGAGLAINKLASSLPQRIVTKYLKVSPKVAQSMVNKGLGTPRQMLRESNQAISRMTKGTPAYKQERVIQKAIEALIKAKGHNFRIGWQDFMMYLIGGLPAGVTSALTKGAVKDPRIALPLTGTLSKLANTKAQNVISPVLQKSTSDILNR